MRKKHSKILFYLKRLRRYSVPVLMRFLYLVHLKIRRHRNYFISKLKKTLKPYIFAVFKYFPKPLKQGRFITPLLIAALVFGAYKMSGSQGGHAYAHQSDVTENTVFAYDAKETADERDTLNVMPVFRGEAAVSSVDDAGHPSRKAIPSFDLKGLESQIIGSDVQFVRGLYRNPEFTRNEGAFEIWQYRTDACVMDIYISNNQAKHVDVRLRHARSQHLNDAVRSSELNACAQNFARAGSAFNVVDLGKAFHTLLK